MMHKRVQYINELIIEIKTKLFYQINKQNRLHHINVFLNENLAFYFQSLQIYKQTQISITSIKHKEYTQTIHLHSIFTAISTKKAQQINKLKMAIDEYLPRIVQVSIALILLIFTISRASWNHIGQNIINFTTILIFCIGLDNIIIPYRSYINSQSIEYESTFVIFFLVFLGILFQKFNRSEGYAEQFNSFCYVIDLMVLIINFLFIIGVIVTLAVYAIRHVYRLMTETLLTNASNLQRHQIQSILRQRKSFQEIKRLKPSVNMQCSICFLDFQDEDIVLMLPGCQHCFHTQCIEEWLNQKATCPNCRSNLRLNIL